MHPVRLPFPISAVFAATVTCAALLCGCGGTVVEQEVQEESYAEVKVMVEDFAALYEEDKARAEEEFAGLSETLAGYVASPIGEQNAIIQQLHAEAVKLEGNFDDADAVTKMSELSKQLIGDTEAFRQEMEENRG